MFKHRLYGALFVVAAAAFMPLAASAQASPAPSPSPMMSSSPMMNPSSLSSPHPAMTGSPAAASPSPSPTPTAPPHLFVLQGYGAASYSSVGNTQAARFITGGPSRVFDTSVGPFFDANSSRELESASDFNNSFDLQNANAQLTINAGAIGGKIEGSFGTDADVIASNGQSRSGLNLTQAYLTYTGGPVTLLAGKFETLAGAEVIESPSNTNFTRSYLFGYAVPFTHTGARLTYAYNSKVSVVVGANDGWDDWKFAGKKKTLEGGILLTPSPGYALTLDTYNGNDFAYSGISAKDVTVAGVPSVIPAISPLYTDRRLYDGVLTLHPTGSLTLIANYDNGMQLGAPAANGQPAFTTAQWVGIAGYLNYQFNPLYGLSLRKETFNDKQGFRTGTGFPQRVQSNTATLNYSPGKYIIRGEYRLDSSDGPNFTYTGLPAGALGRDHQSSLSVEMILKLQ